ncbi:MAG: DUF5119 domain-containing protein [Parabacteroides sp.]|nr:DUF5119 domain-containing protein [Parabacteroides sp.]
MKRWGWIGFWSCLMLLFVSCEHKELCLNHYHRARIHFEVDWSRFGERPNGMTLLFYPQDGSTPIRYVTHDVDGLFVDLLPGKYDVLVFNQSVDEFASMSFRGMNRFMTAEAHAIELVSKWYRSKTEGELVICDPERLGVDILTDYEVTAEMVSECEKSPDVIYTSTLTPENKIYTTIVKIKMSGVQNARSVRASLDGMAAGRMLGLDRPNTEIGTHLLEGWSLKMDSLDNTKGCLTYTFMSFGLPYGHTGKKEANELNLSVLLKDNKTVVDFTYQVGHLFKQTAPFRLVLAIEVSEDPEEPEIPDMPNEPELPDIPEDPSGSTSGFEAVVEGWGEEIEHEVEL